MTRSRVFAFFVAAGLLMIAALVVRPDIQGSTATTEGKAIGPDFGVVFMSSAEDPADAQQYQNALATGATWNRWPFYWPTIEQAPDIYDWSAQDATVLTDIATGLQINAILLGTPPFYTTGPSEIAVGERPAGQVTLFAPERATPVGLYAPIFTDGTDIPGLGKTINPANVWAEFVFSAVDRYRPGGVLAQQHGWPAGVGITHWEMWNEPDLLIFWDGTLADYARLLKVGYLTAKQADPNAQVLFGALANNTNWLSYFDEVLAIYDADPLAPTYNYFHDILATHSYFVAWRSWWHVDRARTSLAARGLEKPIWLNESGVPAWNDYPGPTWDPTSGLRATTSEQADYVIQSAMYARYGGADAVFHFQLYDGCGNQPAGTDFPPHNGELCDANGNLIYDPQYPCAGDANGLFSNPTDAACFTQHPSPESPRPHFNAFQVLTTYFTDVEPLWWLRPDNPDWESARQEWLAFYRPGTGERLVGLWARFGTPETAVVPATAASALLITPDGQTQNIPAVNGAYTLTLPQATNQNAFWDPDLYAIGGRPHLLLETDTVPPVVNISGPAIAYNAIPLNWSGDDGLGSGVDNFDIWYRVDGGQFQPWLTGTKLTSGVFPAEPGHTYLFSLTARDRAGNVSSSATWEVVTLNLGIPVYLPATFR